MTTAATIPSDASLTIPWNVDTSDLPWLYEDEEQMGDNDRHFTVTGVLCFCLRAFLALRDRSLRAFGNMNFYYAPPVPGQESRGPPYVSPDVMIVQPDHELGDEVTSYFLDRDGPSPRVCIEVLSESTAKDGDLTVKKTLYAKLGVREYILVDLPGRFLRQRLLLKRLQPDGTWRDEQDADGGVTSELGFRVTIDADDTLRVMDVETGRVFIRPDEAEDAEEARVAAEEAKRSAERAQQRERKARQKAEAEQQREHEARLRAEQELRDALARLRDLEQR